MKWTTALSKLLVVHLNYQCYADPKRAVGSDDVVTVDFNPRSKNVPINKVA